MWAGMVPLPDSGRPRAHSYLFNTHGEPDKSNLRRLKEVPSCPLASTTTGSQDSVGLDPVRDSSFSGDAASVDGAPRAGSCPCPYPLGIPRPPLPPRIPSDLQHGDADDQRRAQ